MFSQLLLLLHGDFFFATERHDDYFYAETLIQLCICSFVVVELNIISRLRLFAASTSVAFKKYVLRVGERRQW